MVGIQGLVGGPVGANSTFQPTARGSQKGAGIPQSMDGVEISGAARAASQISQLVAQAEARSAEITAERIAEAKQSLQESTYKIQKVVEIVAARVSKYVAA